MKKVAWVIGASSGIGRALSLELANEGYTLALSARSSGGLSDLIAELPKASKSTSHPCDVSKLLTLQKAYKQIIKAHGTIDLVVYSAGIYTPMSLIKFDHKVALEILDVNLIGAINTFEVIKELAISPEKPIHLAWISSLAGYRGLPFTSTYGISKAGLINFAEIQRVELQDLNTKVQVINPGFVKTRLTDKNKFGMPTLITPEEAARYIIKGLKSKKFDISFPPLLAFMINLLRVLPDFLYFKISTKKIMRGSK